METTVTFDSDNNLSAEETAELKVAIQQMLDEIEQINSRIESKQAEIEKLKAETRAMLAELKAAA